MTAAHATIQRFSALIAVFNNLLLICLIKYKSHRKVGSYKYLMIYISVFEILYAVLDALTVPAIYTIESCFLVVIRADQAMLPTSFLIWSDVMFCVFFGISMAIFAVHFIYRYLVVSENQFASERNTEVIGGLLLFPLFFGVFWFWVVYYFVKPFEEADQFLKYPTFPYFIANGEFRVNLLDKIDVNLSDVTYIGPYYWPKREDGTTTIRWRSCIGILIMTMGIFVSFFLIFFFGYKCYRQTNRLVQQASQSASFSSLQKQLFYALVFQTLIPVVLMHIPASIGFIASFFSISFELLGQIPSVSICLYPTLDPLPNFFIIKSYRMAITGFFRKLCDRLICRKISKVENGVVTRGDASSQASRISTAM